ncbi:MAG: flagellar protein [Lachnospiraceae bacterium]|nr:flagellar protein [Lachnospiraceae bacterium]
MKIENSQFLSSLQVNGQLPVNKTFPRQNIGTGLSFQEVLNRTTESGQEVTELKFSKHAAGRLIDRNIELSEAQMERLQEGAKNAGQKGIKDSLVIVDELAFIVNVPNKTVVTALDQTEARGNIFTNIDGAVIA